MFAQIYRTALRVSMHLGGEREGKPGIREGERTNGAGKFVVSPSRDETTLAGKEKLQHKQRESEAAKCSR